MILISSLYPLAYFIKDIVSSALFLLSPELKDGPAMNVSVFVGEKLDGVYPSSDLLPNAIIVIEGFSSRIREKICVRVTWQGLLWSSLNVSWLPASLS